MKHNFSAGPAILPKSVLEQASQAALDLNGMGLSLLEISHRGPEFVAVMDEACLRVKQLLNLDDAYEVLYLSGGASTQFLMVAINLLDQDGKAAYIDTGTWAAKAIKEAKLFGNVDVIASSKEKGYTYIPKDYSVPADASYLHITTNNTIFGTQFQSFPEPSIPLVADMSSDIFSRDFDASKFALIYAGAQKNLGPAGTTLVIIRKDILGKVKRAIPSMLNYQIHIDKQSMFNTPPVFPIYVCMLSLRWIEEQGGLKAMEKRNNEKAAILYDAIDKNPMFVGMVNKEDRSKMNVTFNLTNKDLETEFINACKKADISGLKGHRSVGGLRASIYNAMPKSSVQVLIEVMEEFASVKG